METVKSLIISIVASAIFAFLQNLYQNRKTYKTKYSHEYVKSVKIEFYLGFVSSICLLLVPTSDSQFINSLINVLTFFSMFLALMGFMCLVDVVNFLTDKTPNNTSSNDDHKR